VLSPANALIHFEDVPKGIICDNLKAGVDKASKYEPEIHGMLEDFPFSFNAFSFAAFRAV